MKAILIMLSSILTIGLFSDKNITHTSTATISGKVIDKDSGEPLLFANIAMYQNGVLLNGVESDLDGNYFFQNVTAGTYTLEASYVGYANLSKEVNLSIDENKTLDFSLDAAVILQGEICIIAYKVPLISHDNTTSGTTISSEQISSLPQKSINSIAATAAGSSNNHEFISVRSKRDNATKYYVDGVKVSNTNDNLSIHEVSENEVHYPNESYGQFVENPFVLPTKEALSTFSIDVDRAGYSNIRRYLDNGQMPPTDAVRIEEMINYFDYNYEGPSGDVPIAIHKSLVDCPWNDQNKILHVALQGKQMAIDELPPSNLVFLIDVSGSMSSANKLPLVQTSMKMLLNELRPSDRVAIVVYAGAAGLVLESTPASEKEKIIKAIDQLKSGGSTAGGAGIQLAYKTAKEHYIKDGNNRVIMASDGDFNVGTSSEKGLEELIEDERKSGVYLSVLGFGMGNYKDSKMQVLAEKGNGNHAYIDNIQEARKIIVSEFAGTLYTIAKDVKIQIEFNPAYVQAYRLIGYESRLLNNEDFNNDNIDAGELGAGHTVTAIYEIIPVGVESDYVGKVDDLIYQENQKKQLNKNGDLATIKFRYKKPDGDKSMKIQESIRAQSIKIKEAPERVKFALAVAEFGLILRKSEYIDNYNMDKLIILAENGKSYDPEGYKAECIRLMKSTALMQIEVAAK